MNMSFFTDELAEVRPDKKEFLAQINQLIPWSSWVTMIQPCYYKGERGNKPFDLELMLRIYMLQMLYNLADMVVAAEVIDSRAFSDFCEDYIQQSGAEWRYNRLFPQYSYSEPYPGKVLC